MNPRLIKFVIDLQTQKEEEQEQKYINFNNPGGGKKFFEIAKLAKVTVPVNKD